MPNDPRRSHPVAPPDQARSPAEHERAILADTLATHWPRAARDLLLIAARVDRFNRRAIACGVAPLVADPPLAAAQALWAAIDGKSAEACRGRR